ncbi:putative integral membrane protein [Cryptosporidium felis]|nr:putative integral membrane protein [Cryptosporidium felis]
MTLNRHSVLSICLFLSLLYLIKASITDIPWSVGTPYILTSLEKAQETIKNSRVLNLEEFVAENCGTKDNYKDYSLNYKKEIWKWIESWHSDASVLAGIIFENVIVSDFNKTTFDIKPLLSNYLDTLIWREIVSCIVFGVAIFLFIVVSLGFVLCRVLNDRVVSFEETSQGLWKVKLFMYILVTLLSLLCVGYIITSVILIIHFKSFSSSFSTSVCWFAMGAEVLSNGNININTTSGAFNITELSLLTNSTVPFIGSLPLYGLFQKLGSVESIDQFYNSTIDYIDSAGFSTTLSKRISELVAVFTNQSLINPKDTDWFIPAKKSLSLPVINAANSFLPVNETIYNSMIPILKKIISIISTVDVSSMSFTVSEYFEVFKHFIAYILLFLNTSKISSKFIFGMITALCASSIIVGLITVVFSILHINLFLSGRNHLGFFQSRSALVAVAFIFLGLSTINSFITYILAVFGTVGEDYCGWIVKGLFDPIGMSWISTVRPEIGMIMNICMYPLASYLRKKIPEKRELLNSDFLFDRIRILESHGITNHTYIELFNKLRENNTYSTGSEVNNITLTEGNDYSRNKINERKNNSMKEATEEKRKLSNYDYFQRLFIKGSNSKSSESNSNSLLLAEQFANQEIVGLLDDSPINSSMSILFFQLLPGDFVSEMGKIVPDYLNIISTSYSIAEQCFGYLNITDYIKYSLMYFPDVETSSKEEQDVPVLVLITQSHKNEEWVVKNQKFGYVTYTSLCSSPNNQVSTLMISQTLPLKLPGLNVFESLIEPFKIKFLQDSRKSQKLPTENESESENLKGNLFDLLLTNENQISRMDDESLIISADTDINSLDIEKYHKHNKYFSEYPLSSFKNALLWAKKSMKLYEYEFFCHPFSWIEMEKIESNPTFGNNSLYIKYYNKACNYIEFKNYITSISYDYIINPTITAATEVKKLNVDLNDRIRKMFGSALVLNSIKTEAHNCGQVSVDFTNGIITLCGMIGKTRDSLVIILNISTFIGFAISIMIGMVWIISLRYESRIADSILEVEQSSEDSMGNNEKEMDNVDLKINNANVLN